ncbi:unnamed protein product, partial [Aureobasidium uvarum]
MASLWRPLRLLPPLQSTLSQSLGLRACTPLRSRLLHSSPILHVRKPSKAVVKPIDASAPTRKKQHKDALRKKQPTDDKDDIEHFQSPKLAPSAPPTISTTTYHPSTPPPTIHQPIAAASLQHQPIAQQPVDLTSAHLPPSSLKPTLEYVPGGRSGVLQSLKELASAESPILIYEATKPRQYVAWCLFASLLLGCRPLPFDVPLGRVFSDKGFTESIAYFNATRDVRRKPGVLDALFGPVGTIMSANMKMIQRKSSFAQLRVADSGVWKVDLRDCKVPDGGKTLDLLILPSERKRGWFASLFIAEN